MTPPARARRLLAVSGSLRSHSVNTAVLEAAARLAPPHVTLTLFAGLGALPHFNPDLDIDPPPAPVVAWRAAVDQAEALLICSPEYAHGVPGVLKNALDWLVSHPPLLGKPVALLNARPRSTHAQASLRETLTVMNTRLIAAACVDLPLDGNRYDVAGLLALEPVADALRRSIGALVAAL